MSLLSKNKHFCSIFAILLVPLISIFKELASGTSGKFSWGSSWEHGGEQSLCKSFSARIHSASFNCCVRPMWIFLFTDDFFCFFFCTNVPSIPILVFAGLCLTPLDGTNTCGFAFSSRAAERAFLLLKSVA